MTERPPAGLLVEGLEFAYPGGEFKLRIPACELPGGQSGVVVGPSGCGKTTFLDLVAGIHLPDAGRVLVDGFDWSAHGDAARRRRRIGHVGLVFQEFELLDHLSVEENVLLPYLIHPGLVLDDGVRRRGRELAQEVGLADLFGRRPRQLSQGERQRVALCRALVTEPSLLLADEPTGNLDPRATTSVLELLVGQARSRGMTLLVVTHDHSLLDAFDQVIELGGGLE
jgi:putative ABC transport system ATP-binding protein